MTFHTERRHPFTKQVVLHRFLVTHLNDGTPFKELQRELSRVLENNLDTPPIPITNHLSIKCRNTENQNGKLLVFLSWYEDRIDIPTTRLDALDDLNEETVENADICHLFMSIQEDVVWAFTTISGQQILSKVSRTLNSLLPDQRSKVVFDIDSDFASAIMHEKIKHVAIQTDVDMLALGFPKRNFISRLFQGEINNDANQPHGTIIIDSKSNLKIIHEMESHPTLALEYISEDEENLNKDIYIVTKKNRKIDGDSLKRRKVFYFSPYGRTKTVAWADAKILLAENLG